MAGGYSAIFLGFLHQVIDVWGYKKWAGAFVWIGGNAILFYLINGLVPFQPLAMRAVGGDIASFSNIG